MEALFIVGHWNSGTTLLVELLRKHPQLALKQARWKPELEERTTLKLLRKMGYPTLYFGPQHYENVLKAEGFGFWQQPNMDATTMERFRCRWYRAFRPRGGRQLLLKNPWLFFYPDFIREAFAQDTLHKSPEKHYKNVRCQVLPRPTRSPPSPLLQESFNIL